MPPSIELTGSACADCRVLPIGFAPMEKSLPGGYIGGRR
jgi:hypothetical protein